MIRNPLPAAVRFALYVIGALGDLTAAWGLAKGYLDGADAAFVVGISALLHLLAAAKTLPVWRGAPDLHDEP